MGGRAGWAGRVGGRVAGRGGDGRYRGAPAAAAGVCDGGVWAGNLRVAEAAALLHEGQMRIGSAGGWAWWAGVATAVLLHEGQVRTCGCGGRAGRARRREGLCLMKGR